MGRRVRHHLVSRGHLRAWADPETRVLYIDKNKPCAKLVGTSDVFVAKRLLTTRDRFGEPADDLETQFGKVEDAAIPLVREYIHGSSNEACNSAVKAMIALHFARSGAIRAVYPRLWEQTVEREASASDHDAELRDAFVRDYGRPPGVGELGSMLEKEAERVVRSNTMLVESIERLYRQSLEHFQGLNLQRATVLRPERGELVIADSPVVLLDGLRGSANDPVPLLQADLLWFPLSPDVGVSFTTEPGPDVPLNDEATWTMNNLTWNYATQYIVARAGSHVNRAFGYPGKSISTC